MRISVITPAFNEEKLIGRSVRAVEKACAAFDRLEWEYERIVCDNNSSDRTAELARLHGARVVFEPINQIGRARNRGAAAATGDWLIFVDADSFPSAELFADVAEAIRSGRCLAGGSVVRLDERHWAGDWLVRGWNWLSRCRGWLAGSFIFCAANAFREIGGFNPELFVAEELDLTRRLRPLARREKKRIAILHRHPLLTSARKLRLYSGREHAAFLFKSALRPWKTIRQREQCAPWYDGRR